MRWWLLYILLLGGKIAIAQQQSYTFTHYTTANGLADNSVNSIVQDSRGFIWFSTREGLSRFDGTGFKNFYSQKNDPGGLPANNISSLLEYKPGHLLLAAGAVLASFNTITQQFFILPQFKDKVSFAITRLTDNHFGIGIPGACLILNKELQITDSISPPLKNKGSVPVAQAIDEQTWLIGTSQEYFYYDRGTKKFTPFAPGRDFSSNESSLILRHYDKKNKWLYFFNYYTGLLRYSLNGTILYKWKKGRKKGELPDTNISFVIPKNDSILWMGGTEGGGLMELNTNTSLITQQPITNTNNAPAAINFLLMSYTDRDNNEWLATTAGLCKLTTTRGTITNWQESLPGSTSNTVLMNVTKGNDRNIYVAAFGSNHSYKINTLTNKVSLLDQSKLPNTWCLAGFREELVFSGGASSITKYNPVNGLYKQTDFLKPYFPASDVVIMAFQHSNGDEWYSGNNGGGLVRVSATDGSIYHYTKYGPRGNFTISYYASCAEDKNGDLWMGVNKTNRLLHWDKSKDWFSEISFDSIQGTKGLVLSGITDITTDGQDNLWIAFDGTGIVQYNTIKKTAVQYTIQEGLPTNYVNSLKFDGNNRLWAGTLKGLSCFIIKENRFLTFKKQDGLPADYFEERCMYYDSSSQHFWAGAQNILMRFNPDTLLSITKKLLPVYIDELFVNGRKYNTEGTTALSLSPKQNNLQFKFIAIDINSGRDLEYSYQLTGADKGWVYNNTSPTASYANLSPGNYSFTVRARHKGDKEWTPMAAPFHFTIATPWNKTLAFRLVLIVLLSLLLWFIIRSIYQRKMDRQKMIMEKDLAVEQERTRMARELHDGLGSMLSGLKHSFTALQNQVPMEKGQQQQFNYNIDKLNDTIKELRNISNSMAAENTLQYGLESSLRDYCNFIAQSAGIPVTYTALQPSTLQLSEEQSFHIFRIVQELVQNIVKHADATQAIVQTSMNEGLFYITVEDDGRGFDYTLALKQEGMGLKNILARVKVLKGKLDYKTSADKGTSVMIEFPCKANG